MEGREVTTTARIAVINTGGTISCVGTPLSPMTAAQFAEAFQRIVEPILVEQYPDVTFDCITDLRFPESKGGTLDSTNLQPSDWCLISGRILEDYGDYDAWIVLHGTDSMAYTAGALPFLLSSFDADGTPQIVQDKPVVLTGSQVPLFFQATPDEPLTLRFNTDAYQNVCAAVAMALTGVPEVTVAFRGKIMRGSRVLKVSANNDDAFHSPNMAPLAIIGIDFAVDEDAVLAGPRSPQVALSNPDVLARARDRMSYIAGRINDCPVVPVPAVPARFTSGGPAFIAKVVDAIVATGAKGLVLESYGEGNFPSGYPDSASDGTIAKALAAATAAGVVIADGTQVLSGTVNATAYASGAWLPESGAIGIRDMTPISAITKLIVLLAEEGWSGNGWDADAVRRLLPQSLVGEALVDDRIDADSRSSLLPSQTLRSSGGSATLAVDAEHGLALRDAGGKLLWSSHPDGVSQTPVRARATPAGVVLTGRDGTVLWDAGKGENGAGVASGLALRERDGTTLVLTSATGEVVDTLYEGR